MQRIVATFVNEDCDVVTITVEEFSYYFFYNVRANIRLYARLH